MLEKNIITDVILIDFSKTFDVVPHGKLVRKLALFGTYTYFEMDSCFLHNRFKTVLLNEVYSK